MGFLQLRMSALFGAKNIRIFRNFMVCMHGQEGGADVFYGRPNQLLELYLFLS